MVSVMMATIKITDRGSGVSLRPMGSSNYSLAYISSTEISKGMIIGEKSLAENLLRPLLFCLFSIRIIIVHRLCGAERTGDNCSLSPVILKPTANPVTRAPCFRPPLIWQFLSENSCSVIYMSSPYHHSVE
jgi:hypothetical protein